jgi:hypothetical protein
MLIEMVLDILVEVGVGVVLDGDVEEHLVSVDVYHLLLSLLLVFS